MVAIAERRCQDRSRIDWPISLYHPELGMFINGRSVDVSRSGAKVRLPMPAPIRPGQVIELNFPRTAALAKLAGAFSRIKTARVVRVEPESAEPADGPAAPSAPADVSPRPRRQCVAVQFDSAALTPDA